MSGLPLEGLVVLEFCQYLSGPSAGLRLADLGARVIKIERTNGGDAGRSLAIKDLWVDESSLLFHTINRNKESFTADLKNKEDAERIKKLIAKSDVLIHNFRPGVMEKNGLGYSTVKQINPRLIYGEISGYGKTGKWKDKPGQDLLLQSITGLAYTTGEGTNGPVPFGIAIADILCGAQLVQGILAALIRRHKRGLGALVEISLMESLLDFQFELLTTYYTDHKQPKRSMVSNGHPLLSAPYGLYATADGYLALAMMDLKALAHAINCEGLNLFVKEEIFAKRDEIKSVLAAHLSTRETQYWLTRLQQQELWAMEVFDWEKMMNHEAYKKLGMEQIIKTTDGEITTTRCPIRINRKKLFSAKAAPSLGEHNKTVYDDFIKQ
jgi:crotonobetainyl-CoA:carnitine CoA-transferase CaiB-like acyl-CoA transferase